MGNERVDDRTVLAPSDVFLRSRALVLAASLGALALGLMVAFAESTVLQVDRPVSQAVRGVGLDGFFRVVTRLGSPNTVAILAVAAAIGLWHRCRGFAIALPTSVGLGIALDVCLKTLVDRPRPPLPEVGTGLASFPSGHVIAAVVGFGLLIPAAYLLTGHVRTFRWMPTLAITAIAAVAASRVALGAHWPSDVLASLFIGASVLLVAETIIGSALARRACGACHLHPTEDQP